MYWHSVCVALILQQLHCANIFSACKLSCFLYFCVFLIGPLNTTVLPAGYPVNIAPTLGLAVRAQVDILENDNAHGVIEFALTSTAIDLHEGAGLYTLQLMRTGGLFGAVSVQYMALNLSAHGNGVDFGSLAAPSAGVVIFAANQSTASLDLVIIDDQVAELQERFQIR